jgi:hypothetical protein
MLMVEAALYTTQSSALKVEYTERKISMISSCHLPDFIVRKMHWRNEAHTSCLVSEWPANIPEHGVPGTIAKIPLIFSASATPARMD